VDIIVCDVSFISVTLLIPVLAPFLTLHGDWVILVKPQFEVGRGNVGKGGIVRDAKLHEQACARVQAALEAQDFYTEVMGSPIAGMEGNREFLMHARRKLTRKGDGA
jgi:23S rRNA (cytidine1920-2'-O)/16S rRNA (cytidine1409-2'-O)-methyltransferase